MDSIKLRSKKTGEIHDCDVCLAPLPQLIDVCIIGGEGRFYDSWEDIAKDWEIIHYERDDEGNIILVEEE